MVDEAGKTLPLWPQTEKRLEIVPQRMYPHTPEEYGVRLREQRRRCGYTLQVLAEAVGCTPQNIQKIEEGVYKEVNGKIVHIPNKKINIRYVPIFAEKLGCSCSYLLGYTNEVNGIWNDPSKALHYPIISYRSDEILAVATLVKAYNRDPELFFDCVEMLKEQSPERRGIYKKKIRRIIVGDSE